MTGYVYLVTEAEVTDRFGPVKIGWSTAPDDRLRTMQTGAPRTLRLIRLFAAPLADERLVHAALTAQRAHGEWYAVDVARLLLGPAPVDARSLIGRMRALAPQAAA